MVMATTTKTRARGRWATWRVTMTTATGGRCIVTVRARTDLEAMRKANRGAQPWYALWAERAP